MTSPRRKATRWHWLAVTGLAIPAALLMLGVYLAMRP